jgi:DNA invertase Pin-like site-specific DNA recombinase
MTTVAYVRTSTKDQDGQAQRHAIERACEGRGKVIAKWYQDTGWSGRKTSRPRLDEMMRAVHAGEVSEVVVYKLDRLGRSLQHLVSTVDTIRRSGCNLVSLHDGLDFESAAGRMQVAIMMALAEFEREMIVERVNAGLAKIEADRKRLGNPVSHKLGSPTALTPDQLAEARHLRQVGTSWRKTAHAVGAPPSTVRTALSRGTEYVVVPAGDWRREIRRGVRESPPPPTPHKRRKRSSRAVSQ